MAWEDTYREHEIWAVVSDTLAAIQEIPTEDLTDNLLRLRAVLTEIDGHADQPHAALTSKHLTTVKTTVDTILGSFPDATDKIFATPANRNTPSPFVQLAQYARTWPATASLTLQGLGAKAAQVEASLADVSSRIIELLEDVEQRVGKQKEELSVARDGNTEALADQKRDFEALIEEKTAELRSELDAIRSNAEATNGVIEQQKSRLDSALNTHQEKFASLQEERSSKWSELLTANEAEFKEHLEVLKEYEEQSQNVLSAVGVNATATDYGKYANEQARSANRWRGWAVVAFTLAAGAFLAAATASFLGFGGDHEWWQVVFQKLSAPLGASAIGYVLIRESGQHRKEERRARQVQLTLTALEPFIANLPPDEKKIVRIETARRIFTDRSVEASTASAKSDSDGNSTSND